MVLIPISIWSMYQRLYRNLNQGDSNYVQQQELIEETTSDIPALLANHIDYYAIARDMNLNGEITEIGHDIFVTNAHDF